MVNRLFHNVILVDSAMGNLSAVGGTTNNLTTYLVSGFAFWSNTTLGNVIFAGANTEDVIWRVSYLAVAASGLLNSTQQISFASPLRMSAVKVPALTAGTGWVYLA